MLSFIILYSFSAEAELWNVNTDVDLLSIADVLTSCPLPPETSVPLANLGRIERRPERPFPSFKPALLKPAPDQARNSWRTYHYYGESLSIIASSYFVAVYTSVSKDPLPVQRQRIHSLTHETLSYSTILYHLLSTAF